MDRRKRLFDQTHERCGRQGQGQAFDRFDEGAEQRDAGPAGPIDHLHDVGGVAKVFLDVHWGPARVREQALKTRSRIGARMIWIVTRTFQRHEEQAIAARFCVLTEQRQCFNVARHMLEHVGCDHDIVILAREGGFAALLRQHKTRFFVGVDPPVCTQTCDGALGDLRAVQRGRAIEP